MHESIYQGYEDSFLLAKAAKKYAFGNILEMGVGSGVILKCISKYDTLTGVDINPYAIEHCKKELPHATLVQSDLFENLNNKHFFHTIIFNPPYLPEDKEEPEDERNNLSGGKKGYETIERFMSQCSYYLKPEGIILLLFSSLSKKAQVEKIIHDNLFSQKKIDEKSFMLEKLYVYKLQKTEFLKELEDSNINNIKKFTYGKRGNIYTGTLKNKKVAIKRQRQDTEARNTVKNEIEKLKLLNKHGIGPELIISKDDYFVYKFIEGQFIIDFLKEGKKENIQKVLRRLFDQLFTLDKLKLNKEEMTNPYKHILVKDSKPVLVDFERCKHKTHAHNVTQFVQFLTSKKIEKILKEKSLETDKKTMIELSRRYAEKPTKTNLKKIMAQYGIQTKGV